MTFAALVSLIHAAVLAWALIAPFSQSNFWKVSYVIFAPFLMLHWILNDDSCALTQLECAIRGLDESSSYIHRVMSPLYKMQESDAGLLAWAYTVASWAYAASSTSMDDILGFFMS
jgi:hypothetical protein